jgi:hypothetical protein
MNKRTITRRVNHTTRDRQREIRLGSAFRITTGGPDGAQL